MISGFEWEDEIERAQMGAGITKQMLKYARDVLIPKLEQRRFWVEAFNVLNAQGSPLLQQDLQDEYFFERLARKWKFVRDVEERVWRLHFVAMIKPPPEANVNAIGAQPGQGDGAEEQNPRTMRPDDGAADGALARAAVDLQPPRSAHEILHEFYVLSVSPVLARAREIVRVLTWMGEDAWERMEDHFNHAVASLRLKRAKVAESLTAMVGEMRLAAACAPRNVARLEFVRVWLGDRQTMELAQMKYEKPDWNAWLFGRPLDDDLVVQ
jgi:hypothetical protein